MEKELEFGIDKLDGGVGMLNLPSNITEEKNTEFLSVRISSELYRDIEKLCTTLRTNKSEVIRRLLRYGVVCGYRMIAPARIVELVKKRYADEIYLDYVGKMEASGMPIRDETRREIKEFVDEMLKDW